jgi:DNA (cytosine-5)-methyltransferase 1
MLPTLAARWTVVDLFSGAGGMSYGFAARPEFEILGAVDKQQGKPGRGLSAGTNTHCNTTYLANIGVEPLDADLHTLDPREYRLGLDLARGELTVLIACAPCTGFSQKNALNHSVDDTRNSLVERAGAWVAELLPEFFVMENVKELLRGRHRHHFEALRRTLAATGYSLSAEVHDLAAFGLPQRRLRALVIARRDGAAVVPLRPDPLARAVTVRDAIGHLPPIEAGETHPDDPHHRAPACTAHSLRRIRAIPHDGGSWSDIADSELLIRSMIDKRPGSFPDIYGRLHWDRPAITITRECGHPGNGRYLHPDQDRMLSVREMALLQGFPTDYVFTGPLSARYNQIGDAVPPRVSSQVAALMAGLARGEAQADRREIPSRVS